MGSAVGVRQKGREKGTCSGEADVHQRSMRRGGVGRGAGGVRAGGKYAKLRMAVRHEEIRVEVGRRLHAKIDDGRVQEPTIFIRHFRRHRVGFGEGRVTNVRVVQC